MARTLLDFVRRYYPIMVIIGAFLWAVVTIETRTSVEDDPDVKVIRLAHWQLEAGAAAAFDEMAAEYHKLHPDVRIVHEAIPETGYGAWVSTQLMGGTAPDLIEMGGGGLPSTTWLSFYTRYFLSLSDLANQPNPYNEGTELEGVILRQTFHDGMRQGYQPELQEYNKVPLSMFGCRIFYNKDLLKRLTGLDTPPSGFREFLAVCKQIRAKRSEQGSYYTPIAGSRWHLSLWEFCMFDPITFTGLYDADLDRDGYLANFELFAAVRQGALDFQHPAFRGRFQMMRDITDNFQVGYTGLQRDDGLFLFAQEKAVFMVTGTWDARSLVEQTRDSFELGIIDFPWPTPDDPDYGPLIKGTAYEWPWVSFAFGVYNKSKYPDEAKDFLLFLASQKGNERLNKLFGWIPGVRGTDMDPLVRAFQPRLAGMYAVFNQLSINLQGETWIKFLQLCAQYQIKQLELDEFLSQFEAFYRDRGQRDFEEVMKDRWRGIITDATTLGSVRSRALEATGTQAKSLWVKYRLLLAGRILGSEGSINVYNRLVAGERIPAYEKPYEHRPQALARVRDRIAREIAAASADGAPRP
ncbi:MAG: extracellular solute-binding protein [Nitrospiraceae bacterium]|nr:extracellular solute-binding protein [Nitrospiraceae bacterium]